MELQFREANKGDLSKLIGLLADDLLGAEREDTSAPPNQNYVDALSYITNDSNNELVLVESNEELIGMLQLTFIPYLTHIGSWRCLIEGVRIAKPHRGKGLGNQIINWAIKRASEKGCSIMQLTSDKQRPDAIRFYQSLGFEATHEGFKRKL